MALPKLTRIGFISLVLFAALGLCAINWFSTPPLEVSVTNGIATIDVQNLGEYNSTLSEIVIRDTVSNQIVWRAVPQPPEDIIALWTFRICTGKNPRRFNIGDGTKPVDLVIAVPTEDIGTDFLRGRRYEVEVRGEPWFGRSVAFHAKATFAL